MDLYEGIKIMNIFFDLDGTLLDSKQRLYQLFQHLVPQSEFSFDEYWDLKKNKIGHRQILKDHFLYDGLQLAQFDNEWMGMIELPEWLALDIPFDGVFDYLEKLKGKHNLFIVTARQSENKAIEQIEKVGFANLIDKLLVTSQKCEKAELIANTINVTSEDWLVSDTGTDILTGKKLGINTAAVLSGFMNEKSLKMYEPDIIVENAVELKFK
jgi:phosphoglycolate phosphatase